MDSYPLKFKLVYEKEHRHWWVVYSPEERRQATPEEIALWKQVEILKRKLVRAMAHAHVELAQP